MATKYPEIFAALAADFPDVKWREGKGRTQYPYVTARQVMNRLDDVLGPENWWDDYTANEHSVLCRLTIALPDGARVSKQDAGGYRGMEDSGDDEKAGHSGAFKRAAVKFGVARLLYGDGAPEYRGQEAYTPCLPNPQVLHEPAPRSEMEQFKSLVSEPAPQIPDEPRSLLPPPEGQTKGQKLAGWCARHKHVERASALAWSNYKRRVEELADDQADAIYRILEAAKPVADFKPRESQGAANENGNPVNFGWPHHGSALYAWSKNLEQAFGVSVIKAIDAQFAAGREGGFPRTFKEWTPEQVQAAAVFAAKLVKVLPGYDGQFDRHVPDLAALKEELIGRVMVLSGHHGTKSPTFGQINQICQRHSAALDLGGQLLDDVEQCEDDSLLRAVLDSVNKDIADAEKFSF